MIAYIDVRPFLFIAGLVVIVPLVVFGCAVAKPGIKKSNVSLLTTAVFVALFVFFGTGVGPFVGQVEEREYRMTWNIQPTPVDGADESEVVLYFAAFPGHAWGEYSDQLAAHLNNSGKDEVSATFEITSDYGAVRGISCTQINGLENWQSTGGYLGSTGAPDRSPWDGKR